MEIILAKSAGFCFGVKRATQMAFTAAGEHDQITSLGPLIHSPQMVQKLAAEGIRVCHQVEEIPSGAILIRSHGVTAQELDSIHSSGLQIVDATCPFVKKAQEFAAQLSDDGYLLVLVGEADHPEVQGIVSYAQGDVRIVASPQEAAQLAKCGKIGVVAQTTQSFENFSQIVSICLTKAKEVRIFNTICDATSVRQEEARDIAAQVDLMLVIGGYNSANTSRLATLCREQQADTHHVETSDQLDPDWFVGKEKVGITAGASTPRWIIDNVIEKVKTYDQTCR